MRRRRMILGGMLMFSWAMLYLAKREPSPSIALKSVSTQQVVPVCAPQRIEKRQIACECLVGAEATCPEDADLQEQARLQKEHSNKDPREWDVSEQTTDMEKLSVKYAHECYSEQPEVHRTGSCKKFFGLQEKLCDQGDQKSCLRFAQLLWHGSNEIPADQAGAVGMWNKMCTTAAGHIAHAEACYQLGKLRQGEDGFGKESDTTLQVWRDATEALRLFEAGCNADHGYACYELARLYEKGVGGPEKQQQAAAFMERACKSDDVEKACNRVGIPLAQKIISQPY